MDNSFSLGVLHGLFYAVTPSLPWFMALKHYIINGPTRGTLVYAGVLIGQLVFLWMGFFGWKELIWLWYYVEPILHIVGWVGLLTIFAELYRGRLPDMYRRVFDTGTRLISPRSLPVRREAVRFIGVGALWVFCNPGTVGGTSILIGSIPTMPTVYLLGSLVGMGGTFGLLYISLVRPKYDRLMKVEYVNIALVKQAMKPLSNLFLGWCFLSLFLNADETYLLYYYDNLVGYTPFEQVTYPYTRKMVWNTDPVVVKETRGLKGDIEAMSLADLEEEPPVESDAMKPEEYLWDYDKGELKANAAPAPLEVKESDEEEEQNGNGNGNGEVEGGKVEAETEEVGAEEDPHFFQSPFEYNNGAYEDRQLDVATELHPWGTSIFYQKWNKRVERKPLEDQEEWERSDVEISPGITQRLLRTRFETLRLLLLPKWDIKNRDHYAPVLTEKLAEMRLEMDNYLVEDGDVVHQRMMFPDQLSEEQDVLFSKPDVENMEVTEKHYARLEAFRFAGGDISQRTYNQLHHGTSGLEDNISSAKLRPMPQEVRFPWDFPRVEKLNFPTVSLGELVEQNDIEAMEEVNAGIDTHFIRFLDPVALNTRIRMNDPDAFIAEDIDAPDKYHLRVRDGYRRLWLWKTAQQTEPGWEDGDGNLLTPITEGEFWPVKKLSTGGRSK